MLRRLLGELGARSPSLGFSSFPGLGAVTLTVPKTPASTAVGARASSQAASGGAERARVEPHPGGEWPASHRSSGTNVALVVALPLRVGQPAA